MKYFRLNFIPELSLFRNLSIVPIALLTLLSSPLLTPVSVSAADSSDCKDQCKKPARVISGLDRESAIKLLDNNDLDKALNIFLELSKTESRATLTDLASCYYRRDEYAEALKVLDKSQKFPAYDRYTDATLMLARAECLFKQNNYKQAEADFKSCLKLLSKQDAGVIARLALEGLGACYQKAKDFDSAAKTFEELAKLDRDLYGADDLEFGWALLQLSDAYEAVQRSKDSRSVYEKSIWIFRQTNYDRLVKELVTAEGDNEKEKLALRSMLFGTGDTDQFHHGDSVLVGKSEYLPRTNGEGDLPLCPWRRQFRQTEAPGWVWADPKVKAKAIVVCIHGLGLHHRSFESFARRVSPEGIVSISFDVRGFGSYLASSGQDSLDMDRCVADFKKIISVLRRDYPTLPLFVLGESMGGAIALRLTAESPELMNGLICSVPAATRHKSATTAFKVGMHLITNPNKPMNLESVVNQATDKPELREAWMHDPKARLKMTPKELLHFSSFMSENITAAKKIKNVPVILFQGEEDKLVKKTGTYDLFETLITPEKTLVLLGKTEHLIFEAGQYRDDITLGVIGWIDAHSPKLK